MLDHLKELGFAEVTKWVLVGDRIRLAGLDWHDRAGWLYAFVADDEVKYIGLTSRVLRSRMDNYRDQAEEQNQRIRDHVKSELAAGQQIWIYGLPVPDTGFRASAEQRLRDQFHPPWNKI